MDITEIKSIEELCKTWAEKHKTEEDVCYLVPNIRKHKHIFLPDGIVDPTQFALADRKILFIAKEANWYQENNTSNDPIGTMFWHQKVAFDEVPKTQFSYRLSMLANAIITEADTNYSVIDKSHQVLQSVAVINLNKRGGYSYCIWDTLNHYVKKYQDYIRKQIELIAPDLIVCCGYDVHWLLKEYNLAPVDIKTIWVYHPSYFAISDENYLHQLKCAMTGEKWTPTHISSTSMVEKFVKGIIFDTNKTYSDTDTMDMLLSNKISAFGDASQWIENFNIGDYVFYSVKGVGDCRCWENYF